MKRLFVAALLAALAAAVFAQAAPIVISVPVEVNGWSGKALAVECFVGPGANPGGSLAGPRVPVPLDPVRGSFKGTLTVAIEAGNPGRPATAKYYRCVLVEGERDNWTLVAPGEAKPGAPFTGNVSGPIPR